MKKLISKGRFSDTQKNKINLEKVLDKSKSTDYNKNTENEQMFGGGWTMNLQGALLTVFEAALVAFKSPMSKGAILKESGECVVVDRFVAFEERIAARFRRRRFKVIHGSNISKSYYPEKHRA